MIKTTEEIAKITLNQCSIFVLTCNCIWQYFFPGIRQAQLETVIPKTEKSHVMIVGGKHQGKVGLDTLLYPIFVTINT